MPASASPTRLNSEHVYSCATCRTHGESRPLERTVAGKYRVPGLTDLGGLRRAAVATHEQLVSKSFQGRHGRAFLFTTATNVQLGPKEERVLMTGLHSVCDIFCAANVPQCRSTVCFLCA